jgi:superfamily II DNA or RNA helicase
MVRIATAGMPPQLIAALKHAASFHKVTDQSTFAKHLIVHHTDFTTAEPGTDGASIQAIYSELAADQPRNALITADIADAYRRGRCSLALTNRIEHLNQLADALKEHGIEALVLHGALPRTERDRVRSALSAARPGPLVVLAIDKVAGEGLDAPRLDTLFLTSPISFKGRVIQQVGRLMRNTPANHKTLVEVHDYLDGQVPLLERMQRLARRGFTLTDPNQPNHSPDAGEPAAPQDEASAPAASSPTPTAAQVRAWAHRQGINVPAKGRLRAEVWNAYHMAHR